MLLELDPESDTIEQDLERLRMIRNSVREYMTHNQNEITFSDQQNWFSGLDHEKTRVYLYYAPQEGLAAGYGIINIESGVPYLTGALLKAYRGAGHGRVLFEALTKLALMDRNRVRLDVFDTNERAKKLYESLGYKEYRRDYGVIYLERR